MNKAFKFLFFIVLLLVTSSFNPAQAQVDSRMSGSWFDQTHDGEGLAIEILNGGQAVVYWFSYDNDGKQAWFLWLAFNAPHTPFHLPPAALHDRDLSGTEADIDANPLPYYFAAIEAMDTEIDRLLDSMDAETLANTIIIFVGDNGTPAQVAQFPYSRFKAKGSLYQGGINVPLFISGPGVTRSNERETALVNTTDLFSTIAALAGVNVDQVNDSVSFESLRSEEAPVDRLIQYSEKSTDTGEEWTVADGIYKLIESSTGEQQLYQLSSDPFEDTDLIETGAAPTDVVDDLQYLANQIRLASGKTDWWLPEIKQLYSLINFSGTDPSGYEDTDTSGLVPFIDTTYFDFSYGDTNAGERIIDAQYASNTLYVSNTANDGGQTLFNNLFFIGKLSV